MPMGVYARKPADVRFAEKVTDHAPPLQTNPALGMCRWWIATVFGTGYGRFRLDGVEMGAHRAAWIMANSAIPPGMQVLHCCDVNYPKGDTTYRRCVRPEHLFLGTQADNMQWAVAVGRDSHIGLPGETNPRAKLTAAHVLEIRDSGERTEILAARYGVSVALIVKVRAGDAWRHIDTTSAAPPRPDMRGEHSPVRVLTNEIVRDMRERFAAGCEATALAREYGVGTTTAMQAVRGLTWIDAGGPIATENRIHGPSLKGSANPRARITEADVPVIRASSEHVDVLAKRYGLTRSAIYAIRWRLSWRNVP